MSPRVGIRIKFAVRSDLELGRSRAPTARQPGGPTLVVLARARAWPGPMIRIFDLLEAFRWNRVRHPDPFPFRDTEWSAAIDARRPAPDATTDEAGLSSKTLRENTPPMTL